MKIFIALGLSISGAMLRAAEWRKIATPYFTVISELSESRTRAWASEFEIYRRGLDQLIPVPAQQLEPVTIVLFSSDSHLKAFKPLENGRPSQLAGYFIRLPARNLIALAVEGARDAVRKVIYHEGVHWYLTGLDQRLPLWLEEGLGEIFGTFTLDDNTFIVGSDRPSYNRYVRVAKAMAFAKLSETRAGEMAYNGTHTAHTELFYTQAWVATHDLLFSKDFDGWAKFREYLQKAPASEDIEKNFETGLALTPEAMDARMAAYLKNRTPRGREFTFDRSNIQQGFVLMPASACEVDLALGSLLVGVHREEEAGAYFWRQAAALPDDPRPREALAEMELARGDLSAAVERYREAESRGGKNFYGYFLMGQMAMRGVLSVRGAGGISEDSFQEVTEATVKSLRQNPRFLPAYETLGRIAHFYPAESEAGRLLAQGVARFPYSADVHFGLAGQAFRKKDFVTARAAGNRALGLAGAGDAGLRKFGAAFMAELDDAEKAAGPSLAKEPVAP